jgi:hypothetical protein
LYREVAQRVAQELELSVAWRDFSELNDVVRAHLQQPNSLPEDLYPLVARNLKRLATSLQQHSPLEKLAEIRKLDLFVSLTPDSLMARALDRVRFPGGAGTREIALCIGQATSPHAEAPQRLNQDAPVVFNLFGRATSAPAYAIHDEDVLEYVHHLVSGDVALPDWLMQALRDRPMLMVIGVHLPDWLARFILRAATKDRLLVAGRRYFIARENAPDARTLADFLRCFGRRTRLYVFEGNAATFVDELHRRWFERFPPGEAPAAAEEASPALRRAEIFLSYGRENQGAVQSLHDQIVRLGGRVWFDRADLEPGVKWHQAILAAIRYDVKLFVPVLSRLTVERAMNSEGYVFSEWRAAIERSRNFAMPKFILPVVIDEDLAGANAYRPLAEAFPEIMEVDLGHAPRGIPDTRLVQALTARIRDMRRDEERP